MNMEKLFILPIVSGAVVLLVLGWLMLHPKSAPAAAVPSGAKAGDLTLEACTVKIGRTEYRADCGVLMVPESRADPAARLIALPVRRIRAANPNPAEPIFDLAGGPGQSNVSSLPPAWLLADHDFVQVGYRGVDGTSKLDCPEFAAAAKGTGDDLLSDASLDQMGAAMAACAARLQAEGVDLTGYTLPETVEDMEAARTALGYSRIDLLSESYGTRVAQIYADMHPAVLLRSAMIGVNPPGHMLWEPAVVDLQLAYYENLWRQAKGEKAPDLVTAMRLINADMPKRWLFLPINPGKVKVVSFAMLFHRTTAPIVFDAYLAAAKGDPSGLALMSLAYDFILPNMMTWGEFFAMGASADYEPGRDYRTELSSSGSVLGSPMALMIWGSAAGNWPTTLIPEEYRRVQPSDVDTLLIGGTVDFSTPAQFATDELLPKLSHGKQVILAEMGHTGDFWQFQPEAREHLLASFYDAGVADSSLYVDLPMDFKPAMSFPLLAKIGLAVVILASLGLALLVWAVLRRVRCKG